MDCLSLPTISCVFKQTWTMPMKVREPRLAYQTRALTLDTTPSFDGQYDSSGEIWMSRRLNLTSGLPFLCLFVFSFRSLSCRAIQWREICQKLWGVIDQKWTGRSSAMCDHRLLVIESAMSATYNVENGRLRFAALSFLCWPRDKLYVLLLKFNILHLLVIEWSSTKSCNLAVKLMLEL
jgi:hypothetical protein